MQVNWNSPERRLIVAILWDAIVCFQKGQDGHPKRNRGRSFREASDWLFGNGPDWVFSFERICDVLAIDPEYVRDGLRRWEHQQGRTSSWSPPLPIGVRGAPDVLGGDDRRTAERRAALWVSVSPVYSQQATGTDS